MTLFPCGAQVVLDFCHSEPFRYRRMLHTLAPADEPLALALRGGSDTEPLFFCDRERRPRVLACLDRGALRIEGRPPAEMRADLADWCKAQQPTTLDTSDAEMCALLDFAFPDASWEQSGEYTVTAEAFRPRLTRIVRKLTIDDRDAWDLFVLMHPNEPLLWPSPSSEGAGARDFALMEKGHNVDMYVTEGKEAITGALSVMPLTESFDEVSMVFVDAAHRRLGNGHSLLSQATRDILARGKQPGYSAKGDRVELRRMLTAVGYIFVSLQFQGKVAANQPLP